MKAILIQVDVEQNTPVEEVSKIFDTNFYRMEESTEYDSYCALALSNEMRRKIEQQANSNENTMYIVTGGNFLNVATTQSFP